MANNREIRELLDATAYDVDGDKLGGVKEVYINDASGQPDFIEVNHGLFGMGSSLVPLRGHTFEGDELRLAFQKERIKDAPNVDASAHLSNEDQDNLYRHYSLDATENVTSYNDSDRADHTQQTERDDRTTGAGAAGAAGAGAAGAGVGDAADADLDTRSNAEVTDAPTGRHAAEAPAEADSVVRPEEKVDTGEVRLRRYVTETVEVPVKREEVIVERAPTDGTTAATGAGAVTEDVADEEIETEGSDGRR